MGDVAPSVCTMDDLNMLIGAAATYMAAPWVYKGFTGFTIDLPGTYPDRVPGTLIRRIICPM